MLTRSMTFLLVAAAFGTVVAACSAGGTDGPVSTGGGAGSKPDASAGTGGAAGQAGQGGQGVGGDAGEGGSSGEGGTAGTGGVGGSAGGAGEDSGPPCDEYWTREICPKVGSTQGASVGFDFKAGALILNETSSPYMCGSTTMPALPLKIYQSGLSGDFEVTFTFEKFVSASYGSGVHAYVIEVGNDKESAEAMLLDSGSGTALKVSVTHEDVPQDDQVSTSSTSGSFTIKRVGALVTVMATAGSDKKNISAVLTKNDMRVGIAIQGPYDVPNPPASSSVSILDFTVTNGGGKVVSDTFDCNSVH
ncbi:MAG: hypothetical protein HY898_11320 [Deltaproteobacteria bacterium]|nr:hypothetical protein [Deltaproteobacteria bacterium]